MNKIKNIILKLKNNYNNYRYFIVLYSYNEVVWICTILIIIILLLLLTGNGNKTLIVNDFNKILEAEAFNDIDIESLDDEKLEAYYMVRTNKFQNNLEVTTKHLPIQLPSIADIKFDIECRPGVYGLIDKIEHIRDFLLTENKYCRIFLQTFEKRLKDIDENLIVNISIERLAQRDVELLYTIHRNRMIDNSVLYHILEALKNDIYVNAPNEDYFISLEYKYLLDKILYTKAKLEKIHLRGLLTNRENVLEGFHYYHLLDPYKKTLYERDFIKDWAANVIMDELRYINAIRKIDAFLDEIDSRHFIKIKDHRLLNDAQKVFDAYSEDDEMIYGIHLFKTNPEIRELVLQKIKESEPIDVEALEEYIEQQINILMKEGKLKKEE